MLKQDLGNAIEKPISRLPKIYNFAIAKNEQGLKTRHLLLPRFRARGANRREGFSSLQFFNSAGVCEFAISYKVITQF